MISTKSVVASRANNTRNVPYLIITNISKRQNIRNLLQIAAAYGVPTVFVVGQKKFVFDLDDDIDDNFTNDIDENDNTITNTKSDNEEIDDSDDIVNDDDVQDEDIKKTTRTTDIPATMQRGIRNGKLTIMKFDKLDECVAYIKKLPCCCCVDDGGGGGDEAVEVMATNDNQFTVHNSNTKYPATTTSPSNESTIRTNTIPIIGVEIDNSSINLEEEPFSSFTACSSSCCNCNPSIAFMMGNEGSGMSSKQMSICDGFIRISQYGGGTASLNVSVAAALVLHRYHHWRRGEVVKGHVRSAS